MSRRDFFDNSFEAPNANGTGREKLLPNFDGLAKTISDFVDSQKDSKKYWDDLLAGKVLAFHVMALDPAKLETSWANPFERANDFFLKFNPDRGFLISCEFRGKSFATAFRISNEGILLSYDDHVDISNRNRVTARGQRLNVKNVDSINDIEEHVHQMSEKIVDMLITLGVPEIDVQKNDGPSLG